MLDLFAWADDQKKEGDMVSDNGHEPRQNEVCIGKEVSDYVLGQIGWKSKRAVPIESWGGVKRYIVFVDKQEMIAAGVIPVSENQ